MKSKKGHADERGRIHRRTVLQIGAGFAAVVAGCGSSEGSEGKNTLPLVEGGTDEAARPDAVPDQAMAEGLADAGSDVAGGSDAVGRGDVGSGDAGSGDAVSEGDAISEGDAATGGDAADATAEAEPERPPGELLANIDAVVVLMMENRSFDHYLGQLRADRAYPDRFSVDGLIGTESNPDSKGDPVTVFKLLDFMPPDPPHEWEPCHAQWNQGKNDGFVKAHAGASERDVMGYHDRSQLAFMYWLADNFTVCDNWFASVMGPTWPNRYYLHAATSGGKKTNSPFVVGGPRTVWEELAAKNKTAKNYSAGATAWFAGGFLGKVFAGVNPIAPMDAFFSDAKRGTLPNFSIIDPDFTANDDHPSHDIRLGQAFIASVYRALAASPQWSRSLLVVTYDEHGGFFDHVPPPKCADDLEEFRQLGFRVPALVIGPTVRRGRVHSVQFEHASVAATLATRFGIANLSTRMQGANDLSSCIDPRLIEKPLPPPDSPPAVAPPRQRMLADDAAQSSQPQLEAMIRSGAIPPRLVDQRTRPERLQSWMRQAERLGVW